MRVDYAGAEAMLAALERDSLTDAYLDSLLRIKGVWMTVDNVTRYIPTLGRAEFRQAMREFARERRSRSEHRPFELGHTWTRRAQIRALLEAVRRDEGVIAERITNELAPYRPETGPMNVTAYLVAGGVSTGFAPDTPQDAAFYANLTRAQGDYEGLLWNIAHETYHLMQKAALRRVPGLAAVADSVDSLPPPQRMLAHVLLEGTTELAADPLRSTARGPEIDRARARFTRNTQPDRVHANFALFDTLYAQVRGGQISWLDMYRRGFADEARFYAVGYEMARAIARYCGNDCIRLLFTREPVEFFRQYIRLYRARPEIVGRFSRETERALGA